MPERGKARLAAARRVKLQGRLTKADEWGASEKEHAAAAQGPARSAGADGKARGGDGRQEDGRDRGDWPDRGRQENSWEKDAGADGGRKDGARSAGGGCEDGSRRGGWLREVESPPAGERLDVGTTRVLAKSRSYVQALIEQGFVRVNGTSRKANYRIREGDHLSVFIPEVKELAAEAEDIRLDIVYEDEELLVVNKPQGMVVHPAPGAWSGTLVNALLYHCRHLSGINGVLRPGIVHRIDKDTSGLLVVAKTDRAHRGLAAQIKEHSMTRRYQAIVHGLLTEAEGTIDAPIGRDPKQRKRMAVRFTNSKSALTHYAVLRRWRQYTEVEARLETGRTHQIRVHMAYIGHPVLGDLLYGPKHNPMRLAGQMLHARLLGFRHPVSGDWLEFEAPLPEYFLEVRARLSQGE
ncbi:tRNA pseudouridine38-40 synthase [Acididesulfobacillus acetoxydans]|uniref:RNA pseudouridylate synthase n=1 Tax=Acididesulfobacillus acetoxydans TaxID=1561005 RepID=A0A8S0WHQ4_9FIRM|nr:RluA family pseudouridine synthase [Acididesulfobacillus acetoxydans]CAA7602852.1 tRNA pseudouridine38-40 synthase [Acididesulfobacillus acetoxydans]CEJ05733.1 Ribosomal large subunit pseudouridine synthase D [Acididesulfobacillus acetoxydans]